ncbi:hypothetical protein IWQ60_007973 [Tieghemiomyces parasiticus]|uniref:Zn(2)-C6 fungal-type domain-containing protein n=1 Tax=Tieghemiomyces parasiticus TaxID=78921 RepID=A0A9W7ZZW3_9FUNG|nr:hypothetical protein IWQ60_007973 [Tieghemiomyces parasiticus]
MQTPQIARGRTRAFKACDRCRRRKIGCDGVRPRCATCHRLGHTCCYSEYRLPGPVPRRPRRPADPETAFISTFAVETPTRQVTVPLDLLRRLCVGSADLKTAVLLARHGLDGLVTDKGREIADTDVSTDGESHVTTNTTPSSPTPDLVLRPPPTNPFVAATPEWDPSVITEERSVVSQLRQHYATLLRSDRKLPPYFRQSTLTVTVTTPWLLHGTTMGPRLLTWRAHAQSATPSPFAPLIYLHEDLLFHSSVVHELLYRYCQRIYPVLGEPYYRRLAYRLDHGRLSMGLLCVILSYEAAYSDHPVFRHHPAHAASLLYHRRARVSITDDLAGSQLDNVFALVMMGDNELAFGDPSAADMYLVSAIRLAQRLGLHLVDVVGPARPPSLLLPWTPASPSANATTGALTAAERSAALLECRRVVWWQAFTFQACHAAVFGTAVAARTAEYLVHLPSHHLEFTELNRLLLRDYGDEDLSPSAQLPSLLPEYSDVYYYLPDEQILLDLMVECAGLIRTRATNPAAWLARLPAYNATLDQWLTATPYLKYTKVFPNLLCPRDREEQAVYAQILVRFAEVHLLRIRLNTPAEVAANDPRVSPGVRHACQLHCWEAVLAVRALCHQFQRFPVPCHNLSIVCCLREAATVCVAELRAQPPAPDRVDLARTVLEEVVDFLSEHAAFYPFNHLIVQKLRQEQRLLLASPADSRDNATD